MKKNLLFVAMATMTLASCVQEEGLVNESSSKLSPQEITYQAVVAKQNSRALINSTAYKSSDPSFGVWARYNPTDDGKAGTLTFIENDRIQYLKDVEHNTGYWGIQEETDDEGNVIHGKHYWPSVGSLTFFAYSPYFHQEELSDEQDSIPVVKNPALSSPKAGTSGISFPNYNVHNYQQTDLMIADVQKGLTANVTAGDGVNTSVYTGVPTIFRHKLAAIVAFKVMTSEDYDGNTVLGDVNSTQWNQYAEPGDMRFFLKSIEIENIESVGSYSGATYDINDQLTQDGWVTTNRAAGGTIHKYCWYKNEEGLEFGHDALKQVEISYTKDINNPRHVNPTIYFDDETSPREQYHILVLPQGFEPNQQLIRVKYVIKTYNPTEPTEVNPTTLEEAEAAWKSQKDNNGDDVVLEKFVYLNAMHPQGKKSWEMNQLITYTLKFSTTEIRWAPQIVSWDEVGYDIDF